MSATEAPAFSLRYFLTYRGVSLPLRLVEELDAQALRHRNTYFRAAYDGDGRVCWLEKLVYGEVEMRHDYRYDDTHGGVLREATITVGDEPPQVLHLA